MASGSLFPTEKGLFLWGPFMGRVGRSNPPDPFFSSKKSYGTLFAIPLRRAL